MCFYHYCNKGSSQIFGPVRLFNHNCYSNAIFKITKSLQLKSILREKVDAVISIGFRNDKIREGEEVFVKYLPNQIKTCL